VYIKTTFPQTVLTIEGQTEYKTEQRTWNKQTSQTNLYTADKESSGHSSQYILSNQNSVNLQFSIDYSKQSILTRLYTFAVRLSLCTLAF